MNIYHLSITYLKTGIFSHAKSLISYLIILVVKTQSFYDYYLLFQFFNRGSLNENHYIVNIVLQRH